MKTMRYGRLEGITFTLSVGEVFELLKKAGEIPDGFLLDCTEPEETDWPIELKARRLTLEQPRMETKVPMNIENLTSLGALPPGVAVRVIAGSDGDEKYISLADYNRLRMALKQVGDDYPGSSCQKWCYEKAGLSVPETRVR